MNKLEWKFLEEPIAVKDIEVVERKLGVKLPKDFVDVALKYHGASVTPECLDVGGIKRVFGGIHSFDESSMEYILLHCDYYKEHVNLGFIPFGRDPGGNNFCFDYSESNAEPTIIFWNHEEDIFLKVCSNFTDFLEKLY